MRTLYYSLKILGQINRGTLFFCKYVTIFLVATITIVVCAGVYWRYVLNNSLAWTEETAKFLMVWMVFIGIPIALKTGSHAAIDALPNALPEKGRQILYAVIYLVVLLLMAVLIYQGWGFALNARAQNTATTQISMMYVFGAMPFGGVIMFFVSLELFIKAIIGIFTPSDGVHLTEIDMAKASPE
jgi:TRAP-type C4-dicarboxylate transport system permease small subunit